MREHHRSDDPEVIERELAATRARVDRTIDQIQERLSPGQLLDEGLRYFRDGPSDYLSTFGSNLGHSVRDNPLPVAMIGLGVAWLALGQGAPAQQRHGVRHDHASLADRARAAADRIARGAEESEAAFEHRRQQAMARVLEVRDQAGETADAFKQRVTHALEEATARFEAFRDEMSHRGSELRDAAADGMAHARETAAQASDTALEIFERQPLLAAAAGITVGALLGSLLPASRQEREALAPYGEAVRRQAGQVGSEAAHAAKEAGLAAADAALKSVDRAVGDAEQAVENGSFDDGRDASHRAIPAEPAHPRPSY